MIQKQVIFTMLLALTMLGTPMLQAMDDKELSHEELTREEIASVTQAERNEKLTDKVWKFIFRHILWYKYNTHKVAPGIYRSGLIDDKDTLTAYLKNNEITELVNLRGTQPDQWWYQLLQEVTSNLNITLTDITFNAHKQPLDKDFLEFVKLLRNEKTKLFMDKEGANRAGLAAALYILFQQIALTDEQRLDLMNGQFSLWKYFYFALYHSLSNSDNVMNFSQDFDF